MSIWSTIKEIFTDYQPDGYVQSTPIEESSGSSSVAWPQLSGVDPDEHLWRNLTGINPRDLTTFDQARQIEISYFLYRTNPLAKRIIDMYSHFVWGNGPIIRAVDPIIQDIILDFWHDPVNQWTIKGEQRVRDLCIYGEQAWTLFTNPAGRVRIGYISPARIKEVVQDMDNPELIKGLRTVKNLIALNSTPSDATYDENPANMEPLLLQLHREEDPVNGNFLQWTGDVLYLAINKTLDGHRGVSDLYPLADWIDLYDQFLFSRAEKVAHISAWFWDVLIRGADQKKIEEWLIEEMKRPVRPGAIRAHNESVEWTPMAINLQAEDASTDARAIKSHILSGAGLPPTWFPEGEGTRAAAMEMAEPTMRALMTRQAYIREHLELLFKYVIQQRLEANPELKAAVRSLDFMIEMDSVSSRDLYRSGTAVWRVAQAIQIAQVQGWMDNTGATQAFQSILSMVGMSSSDMGRLEGDAMSKGGSDSGEPAMVGPMTYVPPQMQEDTALDSKSFRRNYTEQDRINMMTRKRS